MNRSITQGVVAWWCMGLILATGSLVVGISDIESTTASTTQAFAFLWQATHPFSWACWTAAWAHLSLAHLLINLIALVGLLALGWYWTLPIQAGIAWFVAWPLSTALLVFFSSVHPYGGLSGVLHAGWAIACLFMPRLIWTKNRTSTCIAMALLIKLFVEACWRPAVQASSAWGFEVAYCAHAMGAVAGLAIGLLVNGFWQIAYCASANTILSMRRKGSAAPHNS
jgi:membrane associated rhomboid family serine protease